MAVRFSALGTLVVPLFFYHWCSSFLTPLVFAIGTAFPGFSRFDFLPFLIIKVCGLGLASSERIGV